MLLLMQSPENADADAGVRDHQDVYVGRRGIKGLKGSWGAGERDEEEWGGEGGEKEEEEVNGGRERRKR